MATEVRKEFLYLNRLRERGVVNMFGAAPYLADTFDLSHDAARTVLLEWMQWVESNPSNREEK
jgi:hypothetical protein